MLEWWNCFFENRDLITFWIAVAGFIMSFSSWVMAFAARHKNLRGKILQIKSYADIVYIYLLLENRSSLPISVDRFVLHMKEGSYNCTPQPTVISSSRQLQGDKVIASRSEYSSSFPIHLSPLSTATALVLFENLQQLPADATTHLFLSICTNRGKAIQKKFELPAEWASQRNNP